MSNIVIVALPAQNERVHKISSEKVPHMTLLFLGENPKDLTSVHITEFLRHVINTTMPRQFGMSVDRRGELGDDKADVLFFSKNHTVKRLEEFRSHLLKNRIIRAAYDSVPQFPEWNPHLTLGYPDAPARSDDNDHLDLYWVDFDRIAIWTGDYEGEEFLLPTDSMEEEILMSDPVEDFLEHFGVKGMKWGVRRKRGADGRVGGGTKSEEKSSSDGKSATKTPSGTTRSVPKKPKASDLTDKELQAAVSRMNLEKQYRQLSAEPKKTKSGFDPVKFTKEIANDVAKTQVKGLLNRQLEAAIKKKIG